MRNSVAVINKGLATKRMGTEEALLRLTTEDYFKKVTDTVAIASSILDDDHDNTLAKLSKDEREEFERHLHMLKSELEILKTISSLGLADIVLRCEACDMFAKLSPAK